jgi:hypothetical protein
LRAANSAAYTSAKPVISGIPEAIRHIGCATVGRIAAAVAVIDAMPEISPQGFNPVRAWQHSFAVAQLCQRLSGAGDESGSVAYLVGLCHDLAEILFNAEFPAESEKVREAERLTGRPRTDLERQMLGMAHAELVPIVLARIGLPETIRTPIVDFHNAVASAHAPAESLARVLSLAELYANGMLLASSTSAVVGPLTRAVCTKATGNAEPPCPEAEIVRAEVFSLTSMLARLSPKDDATLAAPLLDRRDVKVLLVRDGKLSSFDPLAAALRSLAEVHVSDRLPTAAEAKQFKAMIVATCSPTGISPDEINAAAAIDTGKLPVLRLTASATSQAFSGRIGSSITLAELERFVGSIEARSQIAA